ncbi:uncharacterized protein LOC113311147 [Papaver somniferum]|uniref:uncharacterized protein LOC113311147 n=1 Tax=Papaver somniferum TaxID=3469 RepID=UPI000E6FC090|nr:uncharacterized protein LOC113311147 [Papaver somniferum]
MQRYQQLVKEYPMKIRSLIWRNVGRDSNRHADALAFIASMIEDPKIEHIMIERLMQPSVNREERESKVMMVEEGSTRISNNDWRAPIYNYLMKGDLPRDRQEANKIKSKSTNYEVREGVLYRRSYLGPLMRCLSQKEGIEIMKSIHYGDAGNHSGTRSLDLKTRTQGYFWPYMHKDAKDISTRCEACQRFGKRIHASSTSLNSILSVWPFSMWGIDIVGPFVTGTKQRRRKCKNVVQCIQNSISEVDSVYPQSNGKAEATNKTLANTLKNSWMVIIKDGVNRSQMWYGPIEPPGEMQPECHPFVLTYGAEAVLPSKVILPTWENGLNSDLFLAKLDDLEENREIALQHMMNYHQRLSREYNKRVKPRSFVPGELVLREIPPYQKGSGGKLDSTWEGPYIVKRVVGNGAYELADCEGKDTNEEGNIIYGEIERQGRKLDHPWNPVYIKK